MSIIFMILAGAISGAIARFVFPGEQKMGWITTILLGIGGSFLASFLGQFLGWYKAGAGAGLIGSVVGALIILFVWNKLNQPKATGSDTNS
jgi:uncharacterized membrane protein YeaQ/YmgE (transglycosylase-associated protein family)